MHPSIPHAAARIRDADAIVVTAGAGMGVDSGLPDFRGTQGFWRAYPALASAGVAFEEIASADRKFKRPCLLGACLGRVRIVDLM